MLIAIPSKGRAGRVPSLDLLKGAAVLYVPEGEAKAYEQAHPGAAVVAVPRAVRGITKTRNWILRSTDDPRVVMVDDDVKQAGYVRFFAHKVRHRKLKGAAWVREFARLFDVAEELSLRLWGVATQSAPRAVYPNKPFIFHTYVTASCCGIVNDGRTFFDERYPVKEDYELALRLIKEDGAILGARYCYWENTHWTDSGGCKDYRTQAMEERAIKNLMKAYPGLIRRVTRGGSEFSIELEF